MRRPQFRPCPLHIEGIRLISLPHSPAALTSPYRPSTAPTPLPVPRRWWPLPFHSAAVPSPSTLKTTSSFHSGGAARSKEVPLPLWRRPHPLLLWRRNKKQGGAHPPSSSTPVAAPFPSTPATVVQVQSSCAPSIWMWSLLPRCRWPTANPFFLVHMTISIPCFGYPNMN